MMGHSLRGLMTRLLALLSAATSHGMEHLSAAINTRPGYNFMTSKNGGGRSTVAQAKRESKKARNRAENRRYR